MDKILNKISHHAEFDQSLALHNCCRLKFKKSPNWEPKQLPKFASQDSHYKKRQERPHRLLAWPQPSVKLIHSNAPQESCMLCPHTVLQRYYQHKENQFRPNHTLVRSQIPHDARISWPVVCNTKIRSNTSLVSK